MMRDFRTRRHDHVGSVAVKDQPRTVIVLIDSTAYSVGSARRLELIKRVPKCVVFPIEKHFLLPHAAYQAERSETHG